MSIIDIYCKEPNTHHNGTTTECVLSFKLL